MDVVIKCNFERKVHYEKIISAHHGSLMILAMAVAGCGGDDKKADNGSTPHKEKLVIGTDADINNLNLQKQQDAANNVILKNTHQTLVFFNNGSQRQGAFRPRSGYRLEVRR